MSRGRQVKQGPVTSSDRHTVLIRLNEQSKMWSPAGVATKRGVCRSYKGTTRYLKSTELRLTTVSELPAVARTTKY